MAVQKKSSKRHHLGGLTLLHEDQHIIVVEKPGGVLTIGTGRDSTRTVHSILNDYVRKGNPRSPNRVYIVHRLDRDTSGILVLAKSEASKIFLQGNWADTEKHYLAVVHGLFACTSGTFSSYLAENSALNVYSTHDHSVGKLSHTAFTVLKSVRNLTLLDIHLLTGRKHQIRVHLSENGHPVVGDRKYGKQNDGHATLALHARSLSITHPVSGKRLLFETTIPETFTRLVGVVSPLPPIHTDPDHN